MDDRRETCLRAIERESVEGATPKRVRGHVDEESGRRFRPWHSWRLRGRAECGRRDRGPTRGWVRDGLSSRNRRSIIGVRLCRDEHSFVDLFALNPIHDCVIRHTGSCGHEIGASILFVVRT